jgi:hypothetical protein
MALCATVNSAQQVVIVLPQPANISTCALLIPTTEDSLNSPFNLTPADGYAIAVAIVGVWAVGFGIRAIARVLSI